MEVEECLQDFSRYVGNMIATGNGSITLESGQGFEEKMILCWMVDQGSVKAHEARMSAGRARLTNKHVELSICLLDAFKPVEHQTQEAEVMSEQKYLLGVFDRVFKECKSLIC